ncbi:MAG TPA: AlkA N-terminal domain-containing protein [Humibacter sp.]|nr:AlkA N-terminal domain-containing protein [Humibacter sp.]
MTLLQGRLERDVVLRSLVNHSVPGVERVDVGRGTVTRLLRTTMGTRPVTVLVRDDGVEVAGEADRALLEIVREWFDLDTDVDAVAAAFAGDPILGPLVEARPAVRIIGHPDPFEAAVQTVLGQQVSLAACRTFTGRLAAAYGTPGTDGLIGFPDPQAVAAAEHEQLRAAVGITNARARTVLALASAFAGGLELGREHDPDRSRAELLSLSGIGPWTVDYLALRVVRDTDAFPVGDLVLRRALGGVTPAEATAMGERWRPWRAYATMHLWTADAALQAASAS